MNTDLLDEQSKKPVPVTPARSVFSNACECCGAKCEEGYWPYCAGCLAMVSRREA